MSKGNKKPKTGRVTITMTLDRIEVLRQEALGKGLPMPTYGRVLLSEIADEIKHKNAA